MENCPNCGSDDIISPRRCSLDPAFILKTYCPKCDDNIESNERYICHSTEVGRPDFPVYICPGCKSHMHHVPMTKEEYIRTNAIAEEIINQILKEEQNLPKA